MKVPVEMAHEILPNYQPLMLLSENRTVGFEILARWQHEIRGEVEPDVFIPVVEKLNLIDHLTYDLLRRACLDARGWSSELTIALGISPFHLADPHLPVKLLAILSETDFPPKRREIEVTDTALIADIEAARTALVALQDIGVKISLDGFGAGYSSLCNLSELRFKRSRLIGPFSR